MGAATVTLKPALLQRQQNGIDSKNENGKRKRLLVCKRSQCFVDVSIISSMTPSTSPFPSQSRPNDYSILRFHIPFLGDEKIDVDSLKRSPTQTEKSCLRFALNW